MSTLNIDSGLSFVTTEINSIINFIKLDIGYEVFENIAYNLLISSIPDGYNIKIIKGDSNIQFKKILKIGYHWNENITYVGYKNQSEFNLIKCLYYFIFTQNIKYNLMLLGENGKNKFLLFAIYSTKDHITPTDVIKEKRLHWFKFKLTPTKDIVEKVKNIKQIEYRFFPTLIIPSISLIDLITIGKLGLSNNESSKIFINDFNLNLIYLDLKYRIIPFEKINYSIYSRNKVGERSKKPTKILNYPIEIIGFTSTQRIPDFLDYFPKYISWRFNKDFSKFTRVNQFQSKSEFNEIKNLSLSAYLEFYKPLRFHIFTDKSGNKLLIFENIINGFWNVLGTIIKESEYDLKNIRISRIQIEFLDKLKKVFKYPIIDQIPSIDKPINSQTSEELNLIFKSDKFYINSCI